MKLRLDEYYSIINDEWEGIENYMPEDMAEEFENFVNLIQITNCNIIMYVQMDLSGSSVFPTMTTLSIFYVQQKKHLSITDIRRIKYDTRR